MRTRHLANGGNYRGARSELQSGRWIPREREREREAGRRKRERERERERKREKERCDAIFTSIYGEIPGRDTLTTSKQDLWKTPGDLRYHYFPRGVCLPVGYITGVIIGKIKI